MNSSRIKKAISFVLESKPSFYKDKIKSFSDFAKVPFLTREEIISEDPLKRLFVPEEQVGCWVMSSGTTSGGKPLIIPVSYSKLEYLDVLYEQLKENKSNKILLLKPLGYTALRMFDWSSHPKLSSYSLILGDIRNLEMTSRIASGAGINGIETTPSALNFFIPYLKEHYDLDRIKFIRLGGEYTSDAKYQFFRSYFKNAYFDFTFGGIEARGKKGLRCKFLGLNYPPRFFHPITSAFYFEDIDGELVLTTLFKAAFPLIRYKTGDSVSIKEFSCPCGRKQIMEVFGRTGYDSARVGGVTIYRHLIEDALGKSIKKFAGDWELHIYEVVYDQRLVPRLVLKLSCVKTKSKKTLAQKIENSLKVGPNLFLSKLVKEKIFAPLDIQYVDKFQETYKQIKIISHIR